MFNSKVRIFSIKNETDNVKTFRFMVNGEQLNFKPGQYIMLEIPEGQRSFSISTPPTIKDYFELTIKKYPDSKVALALHSKKKGDEITIKGPLGRFILNEEENNIVFLAAGNGITPLRSMIRYVIDKKLNKKMALIYSNKTRGEIIFYEEFKKLEEQNKNLKLVFTLSQEKWQGFTGRIDEKMIKNNVDLSDASFYISGSNDFVEGMINILKEMNIEKEKVHREVFVRPTSQI